MWRLSAELASRFLILRGRTAGNSRTCPEIQLKRRDPGKHQQHHTDFRPPLPAFAHRMSGHSFFGRGGVMRATLYVAVSKALPYHQSLEPHVEILFSVIHLCVIAS
jgi:hypothetical protein